MLTGTSSFAQSRRDGPVDSHIGYANGSTAAAGMVVRSASMETVMNRPNAFIRAARQIVGETNGQHGMGGKDVGRAFFESGLLDMLGYGEPEYRVDGCLDEDCTEIVIRSFTGRPIAVLVFREPGADLASTAVELEQVGRSAIGYSRGLAGITNGGELWLFRMHEGTMRQPAERFDLATLSTERIRALLNFFQHCQVCWRRHLRSPQLW